VEDGLKSEALVQDQGVYGLLSQQLADEEKVLASPDAADVLAGGEDRANSFSGEGL
jgi:hypothetical protein